MERSSESHPLQIRRGHDTRRCPILRISVSWAPQEADGREASGLHSYKVDDGIIMETIAFRLKHSLQHPRSSIHPDHQHKPANIAADAMPTK
jgi:hypothetical protein